MLNRKAAWLAIVLATPLAILSTPAKAVAITYSLSGCTAGSPINGSLMSAPSSPYAPTSCTSGGGIGGTSALTSVQAISNTGAGGGLAGSTVLGSLQAAYIGVYPSLGVTSTAGVDSNTSGVGSNSNLNGSTGVLATGTTLVNNGTGGTGSTTTGKIVVESTAAPQHAMDNSYNREAMLLKFNTAVSLTDVKLGYYDTDSDISIYAYTSSSPYSAPTGGSIKWADLTSNGWSLIGDIADAGGAPSTGSLTPSAAKGIANSTLSSYWLVAAYTGSVSPNVQGTQTAANTLSAGNDFVKLLSVSACAGVAGCGFTTTGVPEPSTVLLLSIALLALTEMRRRQMI